MLLLLLLLLYSNDLAEKVRVGCLDKEMNVGGLMLDFDGGRTGDSGELATGVGNDLTRALLPVFGASKMLFSRKKRFIVTVS